MHNSEGGLITEMAFIFTMKGLKIYSIDSIRYIVIM
jgi:hypothetical protein